MKKRLFALTVAVALLSVLVGCGSDSIDNKGGDINSSKPFVVSGSSDAGIADDSGNVSLPNASENASSDGVISRNKAKELALSHADVKAADVKGFEIELDRDGGVLHYDIEFYVGKVEYDLEIDAKSGEILKFEKDGKPISESDEYIGSNRALEIALQKAGVDKANAKKVDVSLDAVERVPKYEVEFESGGFEYDYDVNAKTGEVIKSEKEPID